MRITTKGRYALRAITNLAMKGTDRPVPIKTLAAEEGISPEFLEQIFFKLKKSGIISSVRGPGGGFVLEQAPEDVSVKDIFDAVGEGLEITPCVGDEECDRKDTCLVHGVWKEASDHIVGYFEGLSLKKIMEMNQDRLVSTMMSGEKFSF
jgi:Rrf2 family transcriptional regulator, iron-sulfur cluster assembly transcription factor